jgi:hypothetical protein
MPLEVRGDVEWLVNRLDDGRWLITILNNAGIDKPQHGIMPTRHEEERPVELRAGFNVRSSSELLTGRPVAWNAGAASLTIPAGAVRVVLAEPAR